ncbi:hypothetical protein BV25DRAFT_1870500 [Artomyces pyxidatus]|uniref:Uncharacterized protein n=1 Tax=Artomyces pyxidatus TaxID=48021 RepID=A0ACB8T1Q4_9AGAM|nr:hypothetical protein BV25DRAFT_1870500 [Artomyces pyxidatus]
MSKLAVARCTHVANPVTQWGYETPSRARPCRLVGVASAEQTSSFVRTAPAVHEVFSSFATGTSTSTRKPSTTTKSKGKETTSSTLSISLPPPTSTSTSPTDVNGLLKALFPVSEPSSSWTTVEGAPGALPLSDATLDPVKVVKGVTHNYVESPGPNPKLSMQAHYPQGSWTFSNSPRGGFSLYSLGPSAVNLTQAKEATFGYSVMFPAGFEYNMGGKMPGLFGGDSFEVAATCSGGSRSDACFSARLMWRTNGAGELYTYLPPYTDPRFTANEAQCNVPPVSECNPTYGASVGRASFYFTSGAWTTVSQRVRLNDVGQANGELELFVNGQSVVNVGGLILRARDAGRIQGMQLQTFFGGHTKPYASPKDQDVYFSDFSVAITETFN